MRPPTSNRITQTSHGTSKAVDHSASPDSTVYAPEDMTFDSYQQRGTGTSNAGNALRGRGKTGLHQFAHLEESYFKGGSVKKGQPIAKMGYTGYTIPSGPSGRHLHYWVQTPNGYVYPPNLYSESFTSNNNQGGSEVFQNIEEVREAYVQMRGVSGSDAEMRPWIGQSKQRWIQLSTLETNSVRQQLADVRQALLNEQAKPPKEVVKIVEKIIEKPVEVIKEIIVEVEPSWVGKIRDFVLRFLKMKG